MVTVTRKGRMFASYQTQYREEMARAMCEGFSEDEKEVIYRGFCKLNDFFTDSIRSSIDRHR